MCARHPLHRRLAQRQTNIRCLHRRSCWRLHGSNASFVAYPCWHSALPCARPPRRHVLHALLSSLARRSRPRPRSAIDSRLPSFAAGRIARSLERVLGNQGRGADRARVACRQIREPRRCRPIPPTVSGARVVSFKLPQTGDRLLDHVLPVSDPESPTFFDE